MLQKVPKKTCESFYNSKMFFAPNHGWGKVKEVSRSYLNVPLFLDFT